MSSYGDTRIANENKVMKKDAAGNITNKQGKYLKGCEKIHQIPRPFSPRFPPVGLRLTGLRITPKLHGVFVIVWLDISLFPDYLDYPSSTQQPCFDFDYKYLAKLGPTETTCILVEILDQ